MLDDFIRCCDCSVKAPDTEIESSPFLSTLGWRVVRKSSADGGFAVEWRCKSCWPKFKATSGSKPPSHSLPPGKPPPSASSKPPSPSRPGS